MDELLKIQEEALAKISACADAKELNDLRVFYLGKKGPIQAAMKSMKTMAPEERKTFGQVSNKTKQEIGQAIEEKKAYLEEKAKASLHVPVAVISDDDFENMRGEEVLKQAIELLG